MGSLARHITRCAVALTLLVTLGGSAAPRLGAPSIPRPAAGTPAIPAALLPVVNTTLGASDSAYAVSPAADQSASFTATNPAQQLTATFTADGVRLGATWGMRLDALGSGAALRPVTPVSRRLRSGTVWSTSGGA